MATKKAKKVSKIEKAKIIVKKINNDLIDASFEAIETTVKTGEKWQKLTKKLIKKTEPLTKQQINMFAETAETIKGQLETGTERLKKLVGFNPEMFEQAKDIVTENPLAKKAERLTNKLKKEVSENPLVKKAEKMTAKIKKEISETLEDITEDVKDKVEDFVEDVQEKVEKAVKGDTKTKKATKAKAKKATTKKAATKVTAKKASVKKTPAKKVVVKKTTAKKTPAKKVAPKKVEVKRTNIKNDLKVIKGIGPKMETLLNTAGITSYEDLAKMTIKSINKVLTDAGIVNIKIYNTSDWKAQAKEAAKK